MECKNCRKINNEDTKYCKYCGELLYELKTCENGHQFNASLINCPYCPPTGGERIINPFDDIKTVIDDDKPDNLINDDKTIIDTSNVTTLGNRIDPDDETIVMPAENLEKQPYGMRGTSSRKLIGWLVTFDISPYGIDFKLYVGKNTIGRSKNNDIVILDSAVSSLHATIVYRLQDKKLIIKDELSTNGTYVNGVLIEDKQVLQDNDTISIGRVNLKVKLI